MQNWCILQREGAFCNIFWTHSFQYIQYILSFWISYFDIICFPNLSEIKYMLLKKN